MAGKNNKIKYFFIGVITTIMALAIIVVIIFLANEKTFLPIIKTNDSKDTRDKEIEDITSKRIDFIPKKKLESLIDYEIKPDSLDYIYQKLSDYKIWLKQGYSQNDSRAIANKFKSSSNQAYGILKGISYNDKSLKLILLPEDTGLKVNFSSGAPDENIDKSITPNTNNTIKKIDLNIKYANNQIKVDYQVSNDGLIMTEYKNDITNEDLKSKQAQDLIEEKLLNINYLANQDDIVSDVLNNLNLDQDFNYFEIRVEFFNNNNIQFKLTK